MQRLASQEYAVELKAMPQEGWLVMVRIRHRTVQAPSPAAAQDKVTHYGCLGRHESLIRP